MATPKGPDFSKNLLFYGDNLDVLRKWIKDESVDLIYLDPPFNSNRTYNVLFKQKSGKEANAQIQAFDDTWTWSQDDEETFAQLQASGGKVADAISAMRQLIGPSDMLSYLVMMTVRLVEMRRALKPTGSLYLHCDPVASHYLKVILDAIFGVENFRNDIVWKRKAGRGETNNAAVRFGVSNDNLLFYAKSAKAPFNAQFRDNNPAYIASKFVHRDDSGRVYRLDNITSPSYRANLIYEYKGYSPPDKGWAVSRERMEEMEAEGRLHFPHDKSKRIQRKRFLDELKGENVDTLWDDISPINSQAKERLGYPTQKPMALLERVIAASSNPGDLVLDPFCGCGTAVDAAERLGRRWIGMDISYLSIDLIETRLLDSYGADISQRMEIVGVPRDMEGAVALFQRSPFDFERWAVSLVDGTPNEKQVGDRGVDGIVRFPVTSANDIGKIVVSVKGGNLNPSMVRDLAGTVDAQKAAMGLLLTNQTPTRGMIEAAQHTGSFVHPLTGKSYPKVQLLTVGELIAGKRPEMPTPFMPYLQAPKFVPDHPTLPGLG